MALLIGLPVKAGSEEIPVVKIDRSEVSDGLVQARLGDAAEAQSPLEKALARLKPSLHKVVVLPKELQSAQTVVKLRLEPDGETG